MDAIVSFNRDTLAGVPSWISDADWYDSLYNYGLPAFARPLIDRPISREPIEADLLCQFVAAFPRANYLEIGTSVGKTFFVVTEYARARLPSARSFTAVDIERINPTLAALLGDAVGPPRETLAVASRAPPGSLRGQTDVRVTSWEAGGQRITYCEGDEFDPAVWEQVKARVPGGRVQVVFSDALHTPSALRTEHAFLTEHDLLDPDGFVYCFDDLDTHELVEAFRAIAVDLGVRFPALKVTAEILRPNGWLGQHEYAHNFGVIQCRPRGS